MEGGGPAQDSGVETECDMESNDSSLSSVSVGAFPASDAANLSVCASSSSTVDQAADRRRSVSPGLPPPPPAGTPEPSVQDAANGERWSQPQLPCLASCEELLTSVIQPPALDDTSLPIAEDGYLGDCSSDGGTEKNFPLPPDWKAKSASHHSSLPPSPAQVNGVDSSPPEGLHMTFSAMEEVEPPAGLQFTMIQQNRDQSSGCGYQLLGARSQREGSVHSTYRPKMRATGFRSRYNGHVHGDWSRVKAAIAERKLRVAANTNNGELVEKLATSGVNVRCSDEHKRSPLHFAAAKGYTEVVDILLRHGADPNQKDMLGNTPLHLAACTNHVPVVTLLLRAGTDITTIDNNGRTPLQLAQAKLKLLQKSSSGPSEMSQVKREVSAVLEMMRVYLARCCHQPSGEDAALKRDAYSQLIDSFSQRLTFHTTGSSLSSDLGNLLDSLGSLSISNNLPD